MEWHLHSLHKRGNHIVIIVIGLCLYVLCMHKCVCVCVCVCVCMCVCVNTCVCVRAITISKIFLLFQCVSMGILLGLGQQRIAAIAFSVGYYCFGLPLLIALVF